MDTPMVVFLFVWLAGMIPLLVVCWLTRGIRPFGIRQLPRALVAAFVFAPSWKFGMGGGGFFPVIFALPSLGEMQWFEIRDSIVIPIVICFFVFWGGACLFSLMKKRGHRTA
jgi:hypothetical protein